MSGPTNRRSGIAGSGDAFGGSTGVLPRPIEEFGPYAVYELLGQGGMATVHLAEKRGVGVVRLVALKRLLPHVADDPDLVKLFVDEARLASHLHHANVAQTYELGRVGDTFFMAMEYASGPTLTQIMRQCHLAAGEIPLTITVNILAQVCEALDYAHNLCDEYGQPLRIIHRDVSPANVIVTSSGVAKLIDFGIAKATISRVHTQTGVIKGKFGYIAPEYINGKIDARADLFAVGVIAHEMLSGRRLFEGKDDFETMQNIRDMELSPPSHWNPRVPPELDDIVMTALERDPDQRWQSGGAMQQALARVARNFGVVVGSQQLVEWVEWAFSQVPRESGPVIGVDPNADPNADPHADPTDVGEPSASWMGERAGSVSMELSVAPSDIIDAYTAPIDSRPESVRAHSPSDSFATVPVQRVTMALSDFETPAPVVRGRPRAPGPMERAAPVRVAPVRAASPPPQAVAPAPSSQRPRPLEELAPPQARTPHPEDAVSPPRDIEVAPAASTFDLPAAQPSEPARQDVAPAASTFDLPAAPRAESAMLEPTATPTWSSKPRARARKQERGADKPTKKTRPQPRPARTELERRADLDAAAVRHERKQLVRLILFMLLLGVGAMAAAYYWPVEL